MNRSDRRSPAGAMALGAAATIVSPLPQFLTGAMAVQITDDLVFGAAGLGLAVALNRAGQAVFSVFLGPLADRLGSTWSLRLSMVIAAVASVGIAATAKDLVTLSAWLVFASLSHSLSQPATNRLLVRRVTPGRLGMAFGLKQAASPGSSMLAGFAVPAVAVTLGWRWAFALVALLAAGVILAVGRRRLTHEQRRTRREEQRAHGRLGDRRIVALLGVAFALALAANVVIPTFYVDSAVQAGGTPEMAGIMLAVGSALAVAVRLVAGIACDLVVRQPLRLCAAMLATGALGLFLLASGRPLTMALGVFLALGGAWGFNGVFWFATVRSYPHAPGRITGALAPWGSVGATVGSVMFGIIAEGVAYDVAWASAGTLALVAAGSMIVGGRLLADRVELTGTG